MGEKTYKTLANPAEAPKEGTLIALDTEFVAIRQPEIEMTSSGERETIRPIVHALARVSVVRGSGLSEGLPFIDDYIVAREPIVDYLTSFSGIVAGDLDIRTSKRNLVSLKIAYKKLWILLNLGCSFIGHGLKQDFRVANIYIPPSQIIDTKNLFFLSTRRRFLSLAFLAWYLLKEDIQLETHDSIEDARTALKLYRKYQEFEDAGILENMLHDIYRAGMEVGYKAPNVKKEGTTIERTDTPDLSSEPALGHGRSGSDGTAAAGRGPSTPARKIGGLGLGAGGTFGTGGTWTPGKGQAFGGSPLR
jgi:PAB-dependent poly(A)-specific ribonuclease subunit 2